MKPSEVLIKAKELLNAHPGAWIKMVGHRELPDGQHAYCALGAVWKAHHGSGSSGSYHGTIVFPYLAPAAREVADELGRPLNEVYRGSRYGREGVSMEPAYFNNTASSLDEVNKMFCRAIEKAIKVELEVEAKEESCQPKS